MFMVRTLTLYYAHGSFLGQGLPCLIRTLTKAVMLLTMPVDVVLQEGISLSDLKNVCIGVFPKSDRK